MNLVLRRAFLLAAASLGIPGGLRAQQAGQGTRRIGFLSIAPDATMAGFVDALRDGLRERGYVEGKNLVLERRYAGGEPSRLSALARELLAAKVELIVVPGDPVAVEIRNISTAIPVVLAIGSDPVGRGLAASLGRPGGSVTGLSAIYPELVAKRFQLIRETVPKLARLGVLISRVDPYGARLQLSLLDAAVKSTPVRLVPLEVESADALANAFSVAAKSAEALLVLAGSFQVTHRKRIIELAAMHCLPAIYGESIFAPDGGLMAFSPDYRNQFRDVASHVDRILRGAKPGDLPIEQPTQFELAVNLRTAKALGIVLPQSILLRADRIIE